MDYLTIRNELQSRERGVGRELTRGEKAAITALLQTTTATAVGTATGNADITSAAHVDSLGVNDLHSLLGGLAGWPEDVDVATGLSLRQLQLDCDRLSQPSPQNSTTCTEQRPATAATSTISASATAATAPFRASVSVGAGTAAHGPTPVPAEHPHLDMSMSVDMADLMESFSSLLTITPTAVGAPAHTAVAAPISSRPSLQFQKDDSNRSITSVIASMMMGSPSNAAVAEPDGGGHGVIGASCGRETFTSLNATLGFLSRESSGECVCP